MSDKDQDSSKGKDWIKKALEEDDFIKRVLPDMDNPDLNVLSGMFLGKGADEKNVRLYTTLELNQYFQIPKDKILGLKRFPSGRIAIWIPGDLRLQLITSSTLSGDFLKGGIQSAYSKSGMPGGLNSIARSLARQNQGGFSRDPFCRTNAPDPDNPICGLTDSGCPSPPQC